MSSPSEIAHGSNYMIFSSSGMQILSALIQFLGVSILAHCLSRRLALEELTSLQGWRSLNWARICILLVLLDSWLFLFTCGILIFGVGLERGALTCSLAIYLCIAFYGTSKIFIYCFLIEKVHVVWSPTLHAKRFKSTVYIICVVTVSLYPVVAILLIIGRNTFLREDGACVIGLKIFASIPLLSYDLYVNIFLTSLFLWPLVRTRRINPRLRRVATRTLLAALAALTTSTVNVLVLTLLHGRELGWVCLGSCGTDVICNALVLFWVTSNAGPDSSRIVVVGTTDFRNGPNDVLSRERCSVAPATIKAPLATDPSITNISFGQEHINQGCDAKRTSGNVSDSRPPWFVRSVAGIFGGNMERQEQHPLEVTITTDVEVVTVDPGQYPRKSRNSLMEDLEPHCPARD